MHGFALLLAAASVGVDYGWQPDADGVMEYIIQIEPELLTALQKGEAIISEIHPDVTGVRRFRIQIGNGPLPRISKPSSPVVDLPAEAALPKASLSPAETPETELPAADNSTFKLEEFPAEPARSPPSDFPLLPLPESTPVSPDDGPPASTNRESSFQLPANEETLPAAIPSVTVREPSTPSPVTDKPVASQKPVPLPDPDRLPLEPARFPIAEKETASRPLAITEPSSTAPRLANFDQPTNAKPTEETSQREARTEAAVPVHRPWLLFSLTIIALIGSLGANAYLGYLFIGLQHRYQGLRRKSQA